MRNLLVLALLTVGLFLPPSSRAGGVAPNKPSDLRTVSGLFSACPGAASLKAVDTQSNPNGTTTAFSIPDKKVFVVTSFDATAGGSAGATATLALFTSDGTGGLSVLAVCGGIAGSNGAAFASCVIPNGAAVKAGSTLCFSASNGAVLVHGFLTKDK
jgi:hypothetical protein